MKQKAIILSAEIQDFFRITEQLESREIEELMNEIHKIINTGIQLHQGKLNHFTGNQFIAAFVSDKSYSKTINAAFEIREQLKSVKENIKLDLKCGIAFGDILSTSIGGKESKQETLMGEVVNNANRICQFAGESQILVDKDVFEATQTDFEFLVLEPIPVKGVTESLEIFEPIKKKRKKLDLKSKSERKIGSEMVGRNRELEQLESHFKQLVAGKGSIVNIVGKAGIGKSRLMAEMKVQPIMEKVMLLEGRALSTGQNLSFHPITNLIRSWAEITEDDIPSVSSEKLYQGIKRNTSEQADEIYSFLATMMGLPLTGKYKERVQGIEGEALEKLILKNLRDLIISSTQNKPRIYLIEDMHWADSSSITLFESLYKLSQNYPVMFINILRPGYKETGDYILKYLVDNFPGDHTTIHINPLAEKESGNLIKNLLRETLLPEEIHSIIIRKTEGNPFFIEEIIRSFIDEGIIEVNDGKFIVTDKINNVNIPETINEAILSRVDKLDEKTRELLNTASVMGRNFYYKVLEEATDTIEELDDRLAYLSDVQLISESKKKQEVEYLFKHALAQQLTYDTLIQQSRKDLHQKIAKSIEKVFARNINEYYSTLAYHYEKAENKEKTEEYLVKAGDEALRTGASSEALNFYEDALAMIPENKRENKSDPKVWDLEVNIAHLYRVTGKNKEAAEQYIGLLRKYSNHNFSKGKRAIKIRGFYSILLYLFMINNQKFFFRRKMYEGFETLTKLIYGLGSSLITLDTKRFALECSPLLTLISKYDFRSSTLALRTFLASSGMFNMTGISFKTSQKMIDFVEGAGLEKDAYGFNTLRMIKRMHNFYSGNWFQDEDQQHVINHGIRNGNFWDTETYLMYSGITFIELGDYDEFIKMKDKLLSMADAFDDSYSGSQAYRLAAIGYYKFRKFDDFLAIAEKGSKYIENTENLAIKLVYDSVKALTYFHIKDLKNAEIAISNAESWKNNISNVPIYHTQYLLAKVKLDIDKLNRFSKADKKYKEILKGVNNNTKKLIAQSKKMVANLTEAYLLKAKTYMLLEKNIKTFKNLKLAIQTGEKYNGRLELSRAYFETGKFLSNPKTIWKKPKPCLKRWTCNGIWWSIISL